MIFEITQTKKGKYRAALKIDGKAALKSRKFESRIAAMDHARKIGENFGIEVVTFWNVPDNITAAIDFTAFGNANAKDLIRMTIPEGEKEE